MKKIGFGIIGSNFITERFLTGAKECQDFELKAIYSRDLQKAQKIASEKGALYAFDDLNKLCVCEEIDAIYIASPTCCHAEQSVKMMKAGKHVICEKPLASNSQEIETMFKTAKENNVILMEAMRPIFNPAYQAIIEAMNKIGKIRQINLNYCQYSSRYNNFKKGIVENAFNKELSNGAIMDIGCYCIQVMEMLVGEPKEIKAMGLVFPGSIDGEGNILAKYEDFLVHINYSKITNSFQVNEIQGEDGILTFENISVPENIILSCKDNNNKITYQSKDNDMYYEIRTFIDAIHNNKIDSKYKMYSLNTMGIIDEARKQIGIKFPADEVIA